MPTAASWSRCCARDVCIPVLCRRSSWICCCSVVRHCQVRDGLVCQKLALRRGGMGDERAWVARGHGRLDAARHGQGAGDTRIYTKRRLVRTLRHHTPDTPYTHTRWIGRCVVRQTVSGSHLMGSVVSSLSPNPDGRTFSLQSGLMPDAFLTPTATEGPTR
jgi:hypothetical protein